MSKCTTTEPEDRVTISLERYDALIKEIDDLRLDLNHSNRVMETLGFPMELIKNIIPSSVNLTKDDGMSLFKDKYRLEFEVARKMI